MNSEIDESQKVSCAMFNKNLKDILDFITQ